MALDYTLIGERLKRARTENGLTQEQLAEKLDVSVAFLSRAECGNVKINLTRIDQICDILNVPISNILTGTGNTSKDYLNEDFSNLLKNCNPEKVKLIYNIAKVIVEKNQ